MQKRTFVTPDDLEDGEHITVLHNRRVEEGFLEQLGVESDYLKGTVLKIVAMNLPYMVVEAADTSRGRATLTIDVRDHQFMRLNRAFVDAVQRSCSSDKPDLQNSAG